LAIAAAAVLLLATPALARPGCNGNYYGNCGGSPLSPRDARLQKFESFVDVLVAKYPNSPGLAKLDARLEAIGGRDEETQIPSTT